MALKREWIASPNYSSRGGVGVRLVVVHTAEGARTYRDLGAYFASPSAGVSSHVGIDDTPGRIGEYVRRGDKAWTQANANPYSVGVELCAFAAWKPADWQRHPVMLENVGRWIGEECRHYGIPITKLTAGQAQGNGRGVCGHADLGTAGGGHWDPGPDFPWSHVLAIARGESPATTPPPAPPEPVLARRLKALIEEGGAMPPEYVMRNMTPDTPAHEGRFGVWSSGLVRRVRGPEWDFLTRTLELQIPSKDFNDKGLATAFLEMDGALRGEVSER